MFFSVKILTISLIIICFLFSQCKNRKPVFEALSSSKTNISFTNQLPDRENFNILYYIYYYNGGGVSTGDINNDGLTDIYFTANNKAANKLYLNKGDFEFEDITDKAGVAGNADWCSGVTMADINGDGYLDIYVSAVSDVHGLQGHNQLFINNGDLSFTESAGLYGMDFSGFSTQAAFFDYDRDGDLDCYLLNHSERPHANIVDTSNRRKFDPLSGDRLYRNDMNTTAKKFTDVSTEAGIYQSSLGYGLGLGVADINNDGWDDIYVGNDFHENDYYYLNNGDGTFSESGANAFGHYSRFSMGNDIADYNNDGHLDIITVDMLPADEKILKTYGSDENPDIYQLKLTGNGYQHQYSKNCLQQNNGNGNSFSETALLSGVSATDWSWAPLFADLDNDGKKDLFVSSGILQRPVDLDFIKFVSSLESQKRMTGSNNLDEIALEKMPEGSSYPYLFKGDGKLQFTDVSQDWGTSGMKGFYTGAAYADLNNDGNLDLVINAINEPAVILKNNAPAKNNITISLKGEGMNTFGIGAKAYLFTKSGLQYQQLMLTRGFQSSSDARLHFGLDSLSNIDSVLVIWPGQKYQLLKNIPANKPLTLHEKDASGHFEYASFFTPQKDILKDVTEQVNFPWKHQENNFDDYNFQYLIPHAQSTRGPKTAIADVNGDGLDDLFTCGAKEQAGMLFIQQKNSTFLPAGNNDFNGDSMAEDVDALFFDANGDQYPDLYVASGGNEYTGNHPALIDRLYINDGKGNFTKSNTLPEIFSNKSCVAAADIDNDGDMDIFVGTLADANAYGAPQTSHLLLNDGKGNFSIATQQTISLQNIGIVTTASFSDINKDGWIDLIVTGEWMPLKIFLNKNGKFNSTNIDQSTGLWQTVLVDDVNGDGHADILAGNWGWNNKFWSGKNGPLKMYVGDFDQNGKTEQLLSYTLNGTEFPFLAKDEVERPLPLLRKHYLLYGDYAGVPMKEVFYGWIDTVKPFIAERLGSVVCYGDGSGNFVMQDLPASLQMAPVFTFQKVNHTNNKGNTFLAGGNFFDVIPYEGRYDAMAMSMFSVAGNNEIIDMSQTALKNIKGQVRDLKWIGMSDQRKLLIMGRNNDSMIFMHINN